MASNDSNAKSLDSAQGHIWRHILVAWTDAGSCDEAGHASADCDVHDMPFFKVCMRLGMSRQAARGWAMMYVRPDIICILYFFTTTASMAIFVALFIPGFHWFTPTAHIPVLVLVISQTLRQCLFWRNGPKASASKSCRALVSFVAVSVLFMAVLAFAGPMNCVPYRSRITTLMSISAAALLFSCAAASGGVEADHPSQPHKSLLTPFTNACFSTLRLVDALTDLGFVRILASQVGAFASCHGM